MWYGCGRDVVWMWAAALRTLIFALPPRVAARLQAVFRGAAGGYLMIYSEGLQAQHLAHATSDDLLVWRDKGPLRLRGSGGGAAGPAAKAPVASVIAATVLIASFLNMRIFLLSRRLVCVATIMGGKVFFDGRRLRVRLLDHTQ